MMRKTGWGAAGATVVLGLGLGAGVANAATAPTWTSVGPAQVGGSVTAVTTLGYGDGKVAEYMFRYDGRTASMYSRSDNESWALAGITGIKIGEVVTAAKALGPNDVLFFTRISSGGGRVIQYTGIREKVPGGYLTGAKFTVLKTFGAGIGSASVISASDIWVFGAEGAAHTLGVWHYNGKTWTQVSKTFDNGSADSATDAWAASGTTLEHWNGSRWTATSILNLVATKLGIKIPVVSALYTGSGSAPFALASGESGPGVTKVAVLEYTGGAWHSVGTFGPGTAVPNVAASDGDGGLWFAVTNGSGKPAQLVHYSGAQHTVTSVALPGLTTAAGSAIGSIAQVPGSTSELLGGDIVKPIDSNPLTAEVYRLD
jgi:hypothetical protein